MFSTIQYVPRYGDDYKDPNNSLYSYIVALKQLGKEHQIPVRHYLEKQVMGTGALYVSLGGDGTALTAMRAAASSVGSVFAINFGNLGFLTEMNGGFFNIKEVIGDLINNKKEWQRDMRMTIIGDIQTEDNNHTTGPAINEILVTTPTRRTPLKYTIFINDKFVATQSGDGVLVTTATGSTAYAMSAGGAIMSPTSRAMQIVPVAAHTLTSRPVVVSEDDEIRIEALYEDNKRVEHFEVYKDGRLSYNSDTEYNKDLIVSIKKDTFVQLWRTPEWNFFDTLTEKMGW